MKIIFENGNAENIVKDIQNKLSTRKLGKMVEFELDDSNLTVTIKKMGTSLLKFKHTPLAKGLEWELSSEKIALSHRAFKADVLGKIEDIVQQIGGKFLN